jgi:nitroimidazol reductase NimA-like FMN-containing flavoprotein (pyridoxamine 5'-phosphate oxidase superfamily)
LRRKDKEMGDRVEVERLLTGAEVGRLATCVDDEPYVVPLSFVYRDGRIIVHGAAGGRKMENISRNPRVCFEVDEAELMPSDDPCKYNYRYRSVVASGRARVLEEPGARLEALRLLVEKYAPGKGGMLTTERLRGSRLAVVEIEVDEMAGKRSPTLPV